MMMMIIAATSARSPPPGRRPNPDFGIWELELGVDGVGLTGEGGIDALPAQMLGRLRQIVRSTLFLWVKSILFYLV